MRDVVVGGALLLSCVVAGCTPSPSTPPTGPATTGATPASQTSVVQPPSTSPSATTKDEDAANLKKALVSAANLGKPWTQPKAVSTAKGKKGEICPGHASAADKVSVTARAAANLTEGRGTGKNIASFGLTTLTDDSDTALVAAYAKDQRACADYQDGSGLFVLRSTEGPASVAGRKLVTSWAERIYYDKSHTKLAYARHTLVARQSRVVTYLSYAFLTVKKDPRAKDFSTASRLLEVQLTKNARVFS
jgi:hypothetical protein